jgi:hypothetical protein
MPSIKKLIAKHLGKQKILGVGPLTLVVITPGVRTGNNLAGGTNATATKYPCKGFLDEERKFMDGTLVAEGRSKMSVLGGTLPNGIKPLLGASVIRDGITYKIHRVVSDPVDAMHECEVSN